MARARQGQGPDSLSPRSRAVVGLLVVAAHLALVIPFRRPPAPSPAELAADPPGVRAAFVTLVAPSLAITTPISPPDVTPPVSAPPPPADPAPVEPTVPGLILHPETLSLPAPRTDLEPLPVGPPPPVMAAASLGTPGPSDPCRLAETLAAGLANDFRARAVLGLIPREARSVANAIMIWDGQWVPVRALGGEPTLTPLRTGIVASLMTLSPDCQARQNAGPILVPLGEPGEVGSMTILALGSGDWRAADIIEQNSGNQVSSRAFR